MTHSLRGLLLSFCLGILCTVPAFTQTSEAASETTSTGPVAYVYVQTSKGVNLYNASAAGKLTLVPGSPFQTEGSMGGSNGKYFITVGTDYLHSYAVASNGAIGKQASEIDTQNYSGSECGNNTGSSAMLDHTGQNFYLMLINSQCMAQQTFDITKGSGVLKFSGAAVVTNFPADALEDYDCCTPLTITGNDAFGYVVSEAGVFWNSSVLAFARESNGTLVSRSFNEIDPTPQPGQGLPYYYPPIAVAADPSGHLAALIYGVVNGNGVWQLASYTVDEKGNIASTNTWENMPTVTTGNSLLPDDFGSVLSMSPSGKLLAVKIQPDCQNCDTPWGFRVFHFNGAAPATAYTPVILPNAVIWKMAWDNSNHLYAIGWGSGDVPLELYVYTVAPTSISEAPGSPYKIPGLSLTGLVVVSK